MKAGSPSLQSWTSRTQAVVNGEGGSTTSFRQHERMGAAPAGGPPLMRGRSRSAGLCPGDRCRALVARCGSWSGNPQHHVLVVLRGDLVAHFQRVEALDRLRNVKRVVAAVRLLDRDLPPARVD